LQTLGIELQSGEKRKKKKNWIGPNESAWRSGRRGIWNKVLYTLKKHGWDTDKVINPKKCPSVNQSYTQNNLFI
jgi:hypothetical protein